MLGLNVAKTKMMIKYNYILIRRQRYMLSWKWGLFLIIVVFGLIIFGAVILIPKNSNIEEFSGILTLILWFLIGIKLMFQTLWQSNETNINLNSLIPLPVSGRDKFFYLMSAKIFSISSIIFITFFSITTIGIIIMDLLAGVFAGILFTLFVIMVDIWITDINLLFGKILIKYKFIYLLLFYSFLIPIVLASKPLNIITITQLFYISKLPVINWPGNGIYAAISGQWLSAGLNMLYIIGFSIVGFLFGSFMLKKIRYH